MGSDSMESDCPTEEIQLCENCRNIDFEALSKRNLDERDVEIISELGQKDARFQDTCSICQLFKYVWDDSGSESSTDDEGSDVTDGTSSEGDGANGSSSSDSSQNNLEPATYFLCICRASKIYKDAAIESKTKLRSKVAKGKIVDPVVLGMTKKIDATKRWRSTIGDYPVISLVGPNIDERILICGRRLNPLRTELSLVKDWLRYCDRTHSVCSDRLHNGSSKLKNLKVIDCKSGKVIEAPNRCTYVALSYVWGKSRSGLGNDFGYKLNGEDVPSVVCDSVTVTKELGFQYLWVDQYCIDQENEEEKLIQLQQMGTIYAKATITIVAAAGIDSSYGLPGVNNKPRKAPPAVHIGDIYLTTVPTAIDIEEGTETIDCISHSKWSERGWTFQEAILSTRRLFFTEREIYFVCQEMQCFEGFQTSNSIRESGLDESNKLIGFCKLEGTKDVLISLQDYIGRQLTYEDDILRAILGVFELTQYFSIPLHHYLGIPLLHEVSRLKEGFLLGLSWMLSEEGMDKEYNLRRQKFPSWSWTGWRMSNFSFTDTAREVAEELDSAMTLDSKPRIPALSQTKGIRLWSEFEGGSLEEWVKADQISRVSMQINRLSRFVHIECWIYRVRFIDLLALQHRCTLTGYKRPFSKPDDDGRASFLRCIHEVQNEKDPKVRYFGLQVGAHGRSRLFFYTSSQNFGYGSEELYDRLVSKEWECIKIGELKTELCLLILDKKQDHVERLAMIVLNEDEGVIVYHPPQNSQQDPYLPLGGEKYESRSNKVRKKFETRTRGYGKNIKSKLASRFAFNRIHTASGSSSKQSNADNSKDIHDRNKSSTGKRTFLSKPHAKNKNSELTLESTGNNTSDSDNGSSGIEESKKSSSEETLSEESTSDEDSSDDIDSGESTASGNDELDLSTSSESSTGKTVEWKEIMKTFHGLPKTWKRIRLG